MVAQRSPFQNSQASVGEWGLPTCGIGRFTSNVTVTSVSVELPRDSSSSQAAWNNVVGRGWLPNGSNGSCGSRSTPAATTASGTCPGSGCPATGRTAPPPPGVVSTETLSRRRLMTGRRRSGSGVNRVRRAPRSQ